MSSILALLPAVGKLLDRVIPDKNARAAAEESLKVLEQSGDLQLLLGQMEINKAEAAHKSIFVAGWRPAVGWVCGFGLLYNVVLSPFLSIWLEMPEVDPAMLYPVLMGMLGMSSMRSFEKVKGVAREK
jgi:hypothetical protein